MDGPAEAATRSGQLDQSARGGSPLRNRRPAGCGRPSGRYPGRRGIRVATASSGLSAMIRWCVRWSPVGSAA